VVYVSDIDLMVPAFPICTARRDEEISGNSRTSFLLNVPTCCRATTTTSDPQAKAGTARCGSSTSARETRQTEFKANHVSGGFDKVKAIEEARNRQVPEGLGGCKPSSVRGMGGSQFSVRSRADWRGQDA
jgi:hypothetical protein